MLFSLHRTLHMNYMLLLEALHRILWIITHVLHNSLHKVLHGPLHNALHVDYPVLHNYLHDYLHDKLHSITWKEGNFTCIITWIYMILHASLLYISILYDYLHEVYMR